MPTVEELIEEAKSLPDKPRYLTAADYFPLTQLLFEEKGLTWREVEEWYREHGVDLSLSSIRQAYARNKKR